MLSSEDATCIFIRHRALSSQVSQPKEEGLEVGYNLSSQTGNEWMQSWDSSRNGESRPPVVLKGKEKPSASGTDH